MILVGIENQMKIHYGMPVRTMLYEALDYTKQCKQIEQMHRKHQELKSSEEFLSGINPDDKINAAITLVVYYGEKTWDGPTALSDMMNIPERFGPLLEFYKKGTLDISSFRKNHPSLNIYWETLAAIGAATGTAELVEYAWEHEGGRINMCTALENLKQEGRQEGLQEGIKATIEILCDMGLEYDTILQKVQDKFHISKSEVEKYL